MTREGFGNEQVTIRDTYGVRITREFFQDDNVTRKIMLQPPSDDRLTAILQPKPAILEMPQHGETFQTLGIQLSPPPSEEEAEKIAKAAPTLTGIVGLTVRQVDCYDAENMVSWDELQAHRPEETGPWTPEAANGLLNAIHVALTTEMMPSPDEAHALPPA